MAATLGDMCAPRIVQCPGLTLLGCRSAIDANRVDLCSRRSASRYGRCSMTSALDALPGPSAVAGGQALVALCDAHGLDDVVGVLNAWLEARD